MFYILLVILKLQSVSMYDLLGKLVAQYDMNGELSKSINISDLKTGIFLIKIETVSGFQQLSKFVKE